MKYYIVHKAQEYVIYKVMEDDIKSFQQKYGTEILVEANSLMELLLRFEQEIMYSLEYIPADIKIKAV